MSLSEMPEAGMDNAVDPEVAAILRSLAPEEVDMLRDAFIYMDRDSDGFVSREEMMAQVAACVAPARLAPLQEYLLPLFQVADKDRDERLSLTEFLMAFADGPGVVPAEVVNSCVADVRVRLTDEEISALQSNFRRIDTNEDGVIDPDELEVALRAHLLAKFPDLTEENFKEIVSVVMASADADQNGVLSLSEFIRSYQEDQGVLPATFLEMESGSTLAARQLTDDEATVLREAFAVLDRNDDGYVDVEDLYHALWDTLGSSTEDQNQIHDLCDLIMMTADRSKSGKLTVTDFVRSFLRNVQLMQIPVSVAHERVRVACEKLQEMHDSGELQRLVMVFEDLDSDGDGFVVRSELVSVLKTLFHDAFPGWDEEMLNSVMTAIVVGAETKNGGQLSLEEFIRSFVEGPGVLPPEAVQTWDSSAVRSFPGRGDGLMQPRRHLGTATDADLVLISEAVRHLHAKEGANGSITEEDLHAEIAQLYEGNPLHGEEMYQYALQQFVVQRKDGRLTWSANVLIEDEEEEVGDCSAAGSPNRKGSSAVASPTTSSHHPHASVPASITEPTVNTQPAPQHLPTVAGPSRATPEASAVPTVAASADGAGQEGNDGSFDRVAAHGQTLPKRLDPPLTQPAAGSEKYALRKVIKTRETYNPGPENALFDDDLKRQFDRYDAQHKGYLDREAFKQIYMKMENFGVNPSPMEVDMRFRRYSNKSDKIFFNEFCILMLQRARL